MACQSVAEIFVIKMANIVGELTICPLMPPSGHTFSVCFCFLISNFGLIGLIRGSNWLLYLLSGLVSLFVLWKLFPMSTCFDGYKKGRKFWLECCASSWEIVTISRSQRETNKLQLFPFCFFQPLVLFPMPHVHRGLL